MYASINGIHVDLFAFKRKKNRPKGKLHIKYTPTRPQLDISGSK